MHETGPGSARGDEGALLVACLCAAWCGSCRDYRSVFDAAAGERPHVRFVWVDIEDHADALAPFDLEVENFPTLLVARGEELRFFGAVLPHASTLARTLDAAAKAVLTGDALPESKALIEAVGEIGISTSMPPL